MLGQPAIVTSSWCWTLTLCPQSTEGSKSYIENRTFPSNILDVDEYDWNKNYNSECGHHASAIIGRMKLKQGKCYYLVENSWGLGSFGFAQDVIAVDGKFWIPEDKLFSNTYKIDSMEGK